MLYLISLGLRNREDMSFKALNVARRCNVLYFEGYTNYFDSDVKELSRFIGKNVIAVKREDLENNSKEFINEARARDVGILVGGDCLIATTHVALLLEARKNNVKVKTVHGSSIVTAISETGLSMYRFGKIASIPFDNTNVDSAYNILNDNLKIGCHTLFLLDLKDNKYMNASGGIRYLLDKGMENRVIVVCCAMGDDQEIIVGMAKDLVNKKFNKYPQCLIVPSNNLHFIEEEMLNSYKNDN